MGDDAQAERFRDADDLMRRAVADGSFPGGVLKVSRWGVGLFHRAYGLADLFAEKPVRKGTCFDLASLTKPLATTPAVMALVDRGDVSLDTVLGDILPEAKGTDKAGISVEHLLRHTSGLPAYRDYYRELKTLPFEEREARRTALLMREPLGCLPGSETEYSDLGFMLLARVVTIVSGQPLDQFVCDRVYKPLGISGLSFMGAPPGGRAAAIPADVASTEKCPWRRTVLTGVVHDDNAFVLGGVDGQAGLFGTATAVDLLLTKFVKGLSTSRGAGGVSQATLNRFLTPPGDGRRALGFDIRDSVQSSAGRYFSDMTIGHLGFTGTSFWVDLTAGVVVVLLTNRVHPSRSNERIRKFRPRLHDAVLKNI
jgi:CubicO group peptidase (beta-lactamase class C family)